MEVVSAIAVVLNSPANLLFLYHCRLLINFTESLDPDQADKISGLIRVQTI